MVGVSLFGLYPVVEAVRSSLTKDRFSSSGVQTTFAGLENYSNLFGDSVFWHSVKVTLTFNLVATPLQIALALFIALLLARGCRGAALYQSLMLIPLCVSSVIAIVTWRILLDEEGLVNGVLARADVSPQPFYLDSSQALLTIVGIQVWSAVSFSTLILLSGYRAISTEVLEAALIDGASALQRLSHVTLPLLKRPLLFAAVVTTTVNFLSFAPALLLTNGGPKQATRFLMYDAYLRAFNYGDSRAANAVVVVILALMLVFVAIQFRLVRAND